MIARATRSAACAALLAAAAVAAAEPVALPSGPYPGHAEIGPGTFLVASRQLRDYHFGASVVLIYEHNPQGTLGTIINRETSINIAEALPEIEGLGALNERLFIGGPVAVSTVRILVRSARPLPRGELLFSDVYLVDELDVLRGLATDPAQVMRFYAGYAGWGANQLESEIQRGDWHVIPGDADIIFAPDMDTVWPALIKRVSGLWTLR